MVTSALPNWLDKLNGTVMLLNGEELPKETAINLVGAVEFADDDANDQTNVPILTTKWATVTTGDPPYLAVRTNPWLALNISNGTISVTLWSALDGDFVVLTDVIGGAEPTSNLVLTASAGQKIAAAGGGDFANTQGFALAGFSVRLKFRASDGVWLPW